MELSDWFERLIAEFRATGATGRSNLVLLGPEIRAGRRGPPPGGAAIVLPFPARRAAPPRGPALADGAA
ncbi:hypothetical protein [Rubellimicrobium aerolatum]|uniref:Uncharacterized protein n=1 Tax=Rubellimicrobium aerolatum TaxID=490979 RepID=A0ABW0SH23_9RHOB|nr:hypothetical protein [Rubellimicrobium aerolatum]MBP1807478.1 hypothetical protein [Rubellimicrobium aerolatum]